MPPLTSVPSETGSSTAPGESSAGAPFSIVLCICTSAERVERALARLTEGRRFTEAHQQWLGRIREHLTQNLSIDRDDFDTIPLLQRPGRWGAANRAFDGQLATLLVEINAAVAA